MECENARAWSAWKILLATAYRSPAQTGTFLAERPQFYDPKMAYRTEPSAAVRSEAVWWRRWIRCSWRRGAGRRATPTGTTW